MIYTIQTTQYIENGTQAVSLDGLISEALQQEFVIGARAFEWNGTVVVAALTTPFLLKSERDSARTRLREDLAAFSTQDIVLTFDMQVYRSICDGLDEIAKQELINLAKSR